MKRHEFLDWADQYLKGELTTEDRSAFEVYCQEHPEYAALLEEHTSFLNLWKDTEERKKFHSSLVQKGKKIKSNIRPIPIQKLPDQHEYSREDDASRK